VFVDLLIMALTCNRNFTVIAFGYFVQINRFDQKKTYNITRGFGGQMYCRVADLKTPMQAPNFLSSAKFISTTVVNGISCNKWQDNMGNLWFTNVRFRFSRRGLSSAPGGLSCYENVIWSK
jgi:hypothetical protein